jgi:hypothetical protein
LAESDWYSVEDAGSIRTVRFSDYEASWSFKRFLPVGLGLEAQQKAARLPDEDLQNSPELLDYSMFITIAATTGWSYGPVDQATLLADVPQHHYQLVSMMMGELYAPLALRSRRSSLKDSSLALLEMSESLSRS